MAIFFKEPVHTRSNGIVELRGEALPSPTPFRVSVSATDPDVIVKVSKYSYILNSPNLHDYTQVIGVDAPLTIKYGDKIWLETFYDKNLAPVFSIINFGPKWTAKVVNTGDSSSSTAVYPNELELISKGDMSGKMGELNTTTGRVTDFQNSLTDEINASKLAGFLTDKQATDALSEITKTFTAANANINDYKKNMTNFFANAPTAVWRKLFRTYTLIAYTTKNPDARLDALTVKPPIVVPSTSAGIPQASEDSEFRIVQCLYNDLLLVDICYQNRFPAKLPVPYHRPVYQFIYNNKDEETQNTK